MTVAKDKVVTIHYVLKDSKGKEIETTRDGDPMQYIHGGDTILEALEKALEGKKPGDKVNVKVACADAYGDRDETLIEEVSKEDFEPGDEITVGKEFEYEEDDEVFYVRVIKVDGDKITVDQNHPLAGMDLVFDVEIMAVRDADPEELEHGHVHTDGVHHDE